MISCISRCLYNRSASLDLDYEEVCQRVIDDLKSQIRRSGNYNCDAEIHLDFYNQN